VRAVRGGAIAAGVRSGRGGRFATGLTAGRRRRSRGPRAPGASPGRPPAWGSSKASAAAAP
jgi:hypothetical protein